MREDNKSFQIIFASSDRDEESMQEYLDEMPWLAIPFGDKRKKTLSNIFAVSGEYNYKYVYVYSIALCRETKTTMVSKKGCH